MDEIKRQANSRAYSGSQSPPVPRTGPDGKSFYDQRFFLELAQKGKEVWNRWRNQNPDVVVTFEKFDFRTVDPIQRVDFSGFDFGFRANLRSATFPDEANLSGASFGDEANLSGTTFGNKVDLSGATFGDKTNLSGASFGDSANLSGATFGDAKLGNNVNLSGATFGKWANLRGATFGYGTNLSGATFGDFVALSSATFLSAILKGATFGRRANLSGVTFGGLHVRLDGATFGDDANLSGARFGGLTNLSDIKFGDASNLSGATFETLANFSGATFGNKANFSGATFRGSTNLSGATFGWGLNFRGRVSKGTGGRSSPEEQVKEEKTLGKLIFAGAQFKGVAYFTDRNFGAGCDFNGARFREPPEFDNCENTDRLDFYGARIQFGRSFLGSFLIPWTTRSDVALQLRRLRNLAEETNNHDLERDLYIEERKAERGIKLAQYWQEGSPRRRHPWGWMWQPNQPKFYIQTFFFQPRFYTHCLDIVIMSIFWLLANYGRSVVRPLIALVLSVFVFQYAYIAALSVPSSAQSKEFGQAVQAFTIANAVPFVGALTLDKDVKGRLLCGGQSPDRSMAAQQQQDGTVCAPVPVPSGWFQALVVGQSIFSALCLFFIGLALRNFFKLK
jgi:Pentapeptide repeats (9 copies)